MIGIPCSICENDSYDLPMIQNENVIICMACYLKANLPVIKRRNNCGETTRINCKNCGKEFVTQSLNSVIQAKAIEGKLIDFDCETLEAKIFDRILKGGIPMQYETTLVKEFHEKFNHPIELYKANIESLWIRDLLFNRARFMLQEVSEYTEAVANNDLCKMYDACIDLLYFIHGTSVIMGWDLLPGFEAVHKSNMTKSLVKDGGGKTIKGPDWIEADIAGILRKQGFNVPNKEPEQFDTCM